MDLEVSPALTIPASELGWRFSRSSGPGGQHVNTSDSRVELFWSVEESAVLSDYQRQRLTDRLARRLVDGVVTVAASEQRSQLRNRSERRRLAAKVQRSATKKQRQRPSDD
jgi:ribosome-associated protein